MTADSGGQERAVTSPEASVNNPPQIVNKNHGIDLPLHLVDWEIEHGFGYGHMEDDRREVQATGHTNGQTPESIGVDYAQATQFWQRILEPTSTQ